MYNKLIHNLCFRLPLSASCAVVFCLFWPAVDGMSAIDDGLIQERFMLKESPHELGFNLFGDTSLTHYNDTFYNKDNKQAAQAPSIRAEGRLGASLYKGKLSIYGVFGVKKVPQTLMLVQMRPEVFVRYLPVSGDFGELMFYGIFKLPFSGGDPDQEDTAATRQGTIFMPGVAPLLKTSIEQSLAKWVFFSGAEAYTKMYSRRQYINEKDQFEDNDRYFLTAEEHRQQKEDTVLPIYSRFKMGVEVSPIWKDQLFLEASAALLQAQRPIYRSEDDVVKYRYVNEKDSYLKIRVKILPWERFSVTDDFYAYHEGFFEKRIYDDLPRYRNMLSFDYIL